MTTIVTRIGKGTTLSWNEMDTNLTNLNNDKLEVGTDASQIVNIPSGGISATDVQSALNELDIEKLEINSPATDIAFSPYKNITSTNIQNAIQEEIDDLEFDNGSSLIGFLQSGIGAVAQTVQQKLRDSISVKDFGAVGDGIADDTSAIVNAIQSLRHDPVSILDTIGGDIITVYGSGTVFFPPGIYKITPDTLKIFQDLGLILKGSGSRRTNNSVRAATTILISGTSSGFGIQAYRSGSRGLTIEDMDICYATSTFTGSILDIIDSPGITLNRVFLGTYGLTGGTRLQTASACIRSTYDEFLTCNQCVFDGAKDGWWSDDTRTELANTFGGSVTTFNQCVWYDFTGNMIRHDGLRTRDGIMINNCAFNPISVDCTRCIDLTNIDGIQLNVSTFTPSVANKAYVEWIRLSNCTGFVHSCIFSDLTQAGTFDGMLDLSNNRVYCTQGFEITGGVITGKGNEFSKASSGWKVSPAYMLCFDIGPDLAKNAVTSIYYIPTDSSLISGRINYSSENDNSTSGIINNSIRVLIENIDRKQTSVSTTGYVFSKKTDVGRTIISTGSSNLTFNLPSPSPGIIFRLVKMSTGTLRIDAAVVGQLYTGVGGVKTSVIAAAGDIGGTVEIEAYGSIGWIVRYNGTWALS